MAGARGDRTSALKAPGWRDTGFVFQVGVFPVERGGPTDHLNHLRPCRTCQLLSCILGGDIRGAPQLNLDELARAQGVVERIDERRGQAVLANVHRRREPVDIRAESRPFLSTERLFQGVTPVIRKYGSGLKGGPSLNRLPSGIRIA